MNRFGVSANLRLMDKHRKAILFGKSRMRSFKAVVPGNSTVASMMIHGFSTFFDAKNSIGLFPHKLWAHPMCCKSFSGKGAMKGTFGKLDKPMETGKTNIPERTFGSLWLWNVGPGNHKWAKPDNWYWLFTLRIVVALY